MAFLDRCLSASVCSRRGAPACGGSRGVAHESGCPRTSGHERSPGWTSFWRRFSDDLWVTVQETLPGSAAQGVRCLPLPSSDEWSPAARTALAASLVVAVEKRLRQGPSRTSDRPVERDRPGGPELHAAERVLGSLMLVLGLQVLVVHLPLLQGLFDTVALEPQH